MENLSLFTAVVAIFSPMVISLITRPGWSGTAKTITMLVWASIVGVGTAFLSGDFNGQDILGSVLLAILVTATSYETIFKPTKISPKIEEITSPAPIEHTNVQG